MSELNLDEYRQFVQDKLALERDLTGAEIGDALGRLDNAISELTHLRQRDEVWEKRVEKLRWWETHGQNLRNAIAEMDETAMSDQDLENAPIKMKKKLEVWKKLVEAQGEYIKFIENDAARVVSFLHVHGWVWTAEDIRKGEELRTIVAALNAEIEKEGK